MATTFSDDWRRFRTALTVQGRVIWALIFREMRTRFGSSKFGYAWALGEPIVYIIILSVIKTAVRGNAAALGTSIPVFFFTGIIPFLLYRRLVQRMGTAISANQALLNYPPVRPIDTLIGRAVLETATMLLVAVLVGLLFLMLEMPIIPDDPLRFLMAIGAAALLGIGFGTFTAAIVGIIPSWATVVGWINLILFFTSGVLFVIDFMPAAIREVLAWLPTAHVVAWARSAHYAGYESIILDTTYALLWGFSLVALGLLAERALRRRAEQ